jgi:tRNA(Ile)-lysidine synthase TilS/MesJ
MSEKICFHLVPSEPTRVVVSLSGGKDSVASLLLALEIFGPELVVAHHQVGLLGPPTKCTMLSLKSTEESVT